ncbi:MAG TPA: helix-turn-helix domain-containing protein [Urbifossiella sp.]|nr:helix-turn-helix domain-containing protein [Urbifossiella sp.]
MAATAIDLPGPPDLSELSESELFEELKRLGKAGWRSPRGASEWLGIPRSEVYGLLTSGAIWSYKRGKRRMVPVVELRRYATNQAMLRLRRRAR